MIKTFTQKVFNHGVFVQYNTTQYETNLIKPNCVNCGTTFRDEERNYEERGNYCIKCDNKFRYQGLENAKEITKENEQTRQLYSIERIRKLNAGNLQPV